MSQLELAGEAGVSTRHLSFVETGRAQASRDMVQLLATRLKLSLREQNTLLIAAGYAPVFSERNLSDTIMDDARAAVDRVLKGHEPYPALAIDRHWTLIASNRTVPLLIEDVDPALRTPPINVLRLSVHPGGLASRIVNFRQWRAHLVSRLQLQIEATADPALTDLLREVRAYPVPAGSVTRDAMEGEIADVLVPLKLMIGSEVVSLFSATTVFGSPVEVTVSEIAIESFFPADEDSAASLRRFVERS